MLSHRRQRPGSILLEWPAAKASRSNSSQRMGYRRQSAMSRASFLFRLARFSADTKAMASGDPKRVARSDLPP